jgi:hypothetical protein
MVNFLILILIFSYSVKSQESLATSKGRMEIRADSVSKRTDSLIKHNTLHIVTFVSQDLSTGERYFWRYYIDTSSKLILKCTADTVFQDYFGRKFEQVVVYFNDGYEFKSCWNLVRDSNSDICSYSNIYPENGEIMQQLGKLTPLWTKENLDKDFKRYIASEIYWSKFFQKKYEHD